MKLFFAEHAYQVEDVIQRFGTNAGEWIALGPAAMACLEHHNLAYTIPEDYCSREEVETVCIDQFKQVAAVCEKLDALLQEEHPFLREWGIRPFRLHLWQLGMLVDALTRRTFQITKILSAYPASSIVYAHLLQPSPQHTADFLFAKTDTLWGKLLSLPIWENEVVLFPEPMILSRKQATPLSWRTMIPKFIRNSVRQRWIAYQIVKSIQYNIPQNILRTCILPTFTEKVRIVIIDELYEWQYLLPMLVRDKHDVYFLSSQRSAQGIAGRPLQISPFSQKVWEEFVGAFRAENIRWLSLLQERIFWIITDAPTVARDVFTELEKRLLSKSIKVALSSAATTYASYLVKQFCQTHNIPVIGWQHGALWYDKRITQRVDLLDEIGTDILLTYGEGCSEAYTHYSIHRHQCRIEAVGSVSIDAFKQSPPGKIKRPRILYAITNYYRNLWYCGFSPPFSDRLYYREQRIIIARLRNLVERIQGISLTVKLHPTAYILDEDPPWVKEVKATRNIRLLRSPGFVELLDEHDVVIIDSPTTTLLQAIATQLPVFVLTAIVTPAPSDLPMLKKRAVCAEKADYLMNALEQFLLSGAYPADRTHRDFLKRYGTHSDDGKSLERAMAILESLLQDSNHGKQRYEN